MIKRVRMMPDGTASVALRRVALLLPKTDGTYKREDVSDPSLSRWPVNRRQPPGSRKIGLQRPPAGRDALSKR